MNYHILDSLDLRAFDNREKDYGVHNYLETLGFVPDAVTLLECSVEQVHSYNGIIDNATVPYLWTCEREMPGGNVWSQRQLYGLVEELHKAGTKFFFGALAQPNIHDEYNTRAEWLMEHADEYDIFIMTRDGGSLRNSTGSINPLRRLPDGRYYEDVFLEDLIRYLEDFHMDGFLAGDGWCGLGVMLKDGDFHPDMIDQFETWSGIKVKGEKTSEQADFIWNDPGNRSLWMKFYAQRWASFFKKMKQGLEKHGKEFVSMDPWARGAVDAIYDYGVDYKLLSESGVGAVCIQAREENWGHRGGEWLYVWEAGEIVSFVTSRAYAPDLHLYWAIATCNAPEHWIAVKDMPNALERQSLSLPSTTFINEEGNYVRATEGLQFIFGTDLEKQDWKFLKDRWDIGFEEPMLKTNGPVLVFSDAVYQYHLDRGERWELTAPGLRAIMAGASIHCAVNSKNLKKSNADGYVLVNPMGITNEEVEALLEKNRQGAGIVVIGNTDNEYLIRELGLKRAEAKEADCLCLDQEAIEKYWKGIDCDALACVKDGKFVEQVVSVKPVYNTKSRTEDKALFQAVDAQVLIGLQTEAGIYAGTTIRKTGENTGLRMYVSRSYEWPKTLARWNFKFTMRSFAEELPDDVDRLNAHLMNRVCGNIAHASEGQIYQYEIHEDGTLHIGLGNMGNMFYGKPVLYVEDDICFHDDYAIQRYTPGGYIHFDTTLHTIKVEVPPLGSTHVKLKRK